MWIINHKVIFLSIHCRKKRSQVGRISIRPFPQQQQQKQPPEFSLGGASRLLCRKLTRSLHLSWTCLHGLLLPACLPATKLQYIGGKLRDVSGRTVPREECLMECWSPPLSCINGPLSKYSNCCTGARLCEPGRHLLHTHCCDPLIMRLSGAARVCEIKRNAAASPTNRLLTALTNRWRAFPPP